MNLVVRIIQVVLALTALNGIYGFALQMGFSAFSTENRLTLWNIIGSIVTILTLVFIIFLLQRYYEFRNKGQLNISNKKLFGAALTGTGIALLLGFSIVVLIVGIAFLNL